MHKLESPVDITNPNNVKVVSGPNNQALYFSRSPIPYNRDNIPDVTYYKHIGVYAYTKKALLEFIKLPIGKLESIEKLEQLRFLENGYKIKMVVTNYRGIGIDTPEDLSAAEEYLSRVEAGFPAPLFKPCMRFSRTRLTDKVHSKHSQVCQEDLYAKLYKP
jgi:CMP-2-keto-3-deoxyoctulosonic acid synthetase